MGPADLARRLGITIKALRVYERQGLVKPRRSRQGWRVYAPEDIERLSRALALKAMGFGLSQIAGLLDAGPDEMAVALAAQEARLVGERARLEKALGSVRDARRQRVASALKLVA
ncbi:MAG: MerR family transcriptional regulator [Caulobacter sp.]|nr:MerR family transcriptional regulator [Caulobacter sp.]